MNEELPSYRDVARNWTEKHADALKDLADVVVNTDRCNAGDVFARVAARIEQRPVLSQPLVDVLVGGQYGSEGKGNIAQYLAPEYDVLVRVGGPNAGHKVFRPGQEPYTFRQLPSGALGTTPRADGLFTGYLTTMNLATNAISNPISISDGYHSKLLFADDNTMWIAAQQCANGERQATGQNYNCLTMVNLGSTPKATIIPNLTPGGATTVPFPNTNQNPYYYGSLTGLCWVQEYHKIFTAYGGQVHAFYTGGSIVSNLDPGFGTTPAAGTEINNTNFTIQGTVLDIAYIDALDNNAD